MDKQTLRFFELLVTNQEKIKEKLDDLEDTIDDLDYRIEELE